MGWFSSSSDSKPQKASDGGSIAPDRSSRQHCYVARDSFFDCLDKNHITDALKEDKKARKNCAKEIQDFESACSETWGKYFKEKRTMEIRRNEMVERIKREDAEELELNK